MSFLVSKILWVFLAPGNLLVLVLLIGGFLAVAQREPWRSVGRRLCFGTALVLFLVAILPIGDWMLTPLENSFVLAKLDHVDGIILVGEDENPEVAATRGHAASNFAADDYITFTSLARRFPQAKLVYTGGTGQITPDPDMSNATVARTALSSIGLPVEKMVFEEKSRTTHENAVEAAALVHPTTQQQWYLVTSAMHMPRSMACFRKQGWNVYPAPASYVTDGTYAFRLRFALGVHLLQMTAAFHEYVGLVAYRLLGYTDDVWPK